MKTITDRQQEILDLFLVHGNKRKVARELGMNESSVRYALRAAEAKGLAPWLSPVAIPDHLSLSKTTVQYNKDGEVIQEWKRLIPMAQNMEDFVTSLCERVEGKANVKTKEPYKTQNDSVLAEMSIYDSHIGMYASAKETNDKDYNCEIAGNLMVNTAEALASRFNKPSRIVVTFGGDIMHSDQRNNRTEKNSNPLDVDSRFHRVVDYAIKACYDVVQIAASVAPKVDVVIVEGNHDWHSCVWLTKVLSAFYSNCENINVINQQSDRKTYLFGTNLLVWSHGDGVPMAQWPQIIAAEFAGLWGISKFRHLKMGHVHHKKKNQPLRVISETKNGWEEHRGLLVEYLPALCSTDAWHAEKGFVGSVKGASGFEYHKQHGLITRYYQHVL